MTVLDSEIKFYRSAVVSDSPANGGRMGVVDAVSAVAQAVFPDVPESERTAGSTKYRKLFLKIENPSDEALLNTYLFFDQTTPADDSIRFFLGSQTDTQADIMSPTRYGVGRLDSTVSSGAGSVAVLVENWSAGVIFRDGDSIRISDGVNEEIHTINGVPGVAGNVITLTLTGTLTNGYNSANTFISSGLDLGTIQAVFDSWVETAAVSGTYAEGTPGNVVVNAIGGIEQNWTLTFTNATAFNLSGNTLGALGSGSVAGNFSPNNPDFSSPYFTILSAGWGGTWQAADTVTFSTRPASKAIWYERVVPPGAAALAANYVDNVVIGESV